MRLDKLDNKYKVIIIILIIVPLYIFIYYDMMQNDKNNFQLYYKCGDKIFTLNETKDFHCNMYHIKYNHRTKNIKTISHQYYKRNKQIEIMVNKSFNKMINKSFDSPS